MIASTRELTLHVNLFRTGKIARPSCPLSPTFTHERLGSLRIAYAHTPTRHTKFGERPFVPTRIIAKLTRVNTASPVKRTPHPAPRAHRGSTRVCRSWLCSRPRDPATPAPFECQIRSRAGAWRTSAETYGSSRALRQASGADRVCHGPLNHRFM